MCPTRRARVNARLAVCKPPTFSYELTALDPSIQCCLEAVTIDLASFVKQNYGNECRVLLMDVYEGQSPSSDLALAVWLPKTPDDPIGESLRVLAAFQKLLGNASHGVLIA